MNKIELIKALLSEESSCETKESHLTNPDGDIRIVILHRGWVVVGRVYQSGCEVKIKNGAVIRVWGTSGGLGELAEKGPLSNTKLDKQSNTMIVHEAAIIAQLEVSQSKWSDVCS